MNRKSIRKIPPDGGWGWVVLLSGFMATTLATLPLVSYGILFHYLFISHKSSSTTIAWIFNIHGFIWNVFILFIGPLCEEFSHRKIAVVGGILNCLSLILCAFSTSTEFLYFSYSVVGSIGESICNTMAFFIVPKYFDKHRGLALGLLSTGTGIGTFVSPLLANLFLETYGWRVATFLCGIIVLNHCACGLLYHPIKWYLKTVPMDDCILGKSSSDGADKDLADSQFIIMGTHENLSCQKVQELSKESYIDSLESEAEENNQSLPKSLSASVKSENMFQRIFNSTLSNIKMLKHLQILIVAVCSGFLILGYINFQMWIPFIIFDAGHSLKLGAWCISLASIGNLFGRILMTIMADRKCFNVQYGYMFGLLISGVSIIGYSFVVEIYSFFTLSVTWGFGIGCAMGLHFTVLLNQVGQKRYPGVIGVSSLSIGFQTLLIGPFVGFVRGLTNSFKYSIWFIGGLEILAFFFWLMMPVATKYDKKYRK